MILGYVVDGNTVTEGDARRLTHIHCAFGYLTKEGELSVEKLNMLGQISLWRQCKAPTSSAILRMRA